MFTHYVCMYNGNSSILIFHDYENYFFFQVVNRLPAPLKQQSQINIRNYGKSSFPTLLKTGKVIPSFFLNSRSFKTAQCVNTIPIKEIGKAKAMAPPSVSEKCQQLIKESQVVIFSKSYCPFCSRVS